MICSTPAPLNYRRPSTFSAACPGCGRPFLGLLAALSAGLPTAFAAVTVVVLVSLFPATVEGQGDSEPCPGGGYNPPPSAVEVTAVPIVVTSTTADYFVLYVKHDVDGTEVELPVLVKLGEAGTTTLAENVEALPKERYRVEKYLVADPADVDGDCTDDITELADPVGMNPVNPAAIELSDGAVAVPDQETREMISTRSNARRYLKFVLFDMDTDAPGVYFMNTETHPGHAAFLDLIGLEWNQDGLISGQIIYHPELVAPDGSPGVYTFYWDSVRVGRREKNEPDGSWVYQSYHFSLVTRSYTVLAASMPLLDDNLAFYIRNSDLPFLQTDLPLYRESRIPLVFDEDIYAETSFLALNPGEGYGLLRIMDPDERPHPRDIVIYEALPNELPRVAGIITTVPQTPLSHVNLRAVQDGIPNAFISDALDKPAIDDLIGGYVRYEVTESGWELRAATPAEVDAHYASSRPAEAQTPQRDLTVTALTPLSQVGFEDWDVFGVKAANVAVLGTLGFPAGTVPAGFAIPFYFYDEFMKAHDFYTRIETMLANEDFQTDFEVQDDRLDDLRDDIKDAETPQWIINALTAMHATYPEGQSLRYRSSTNNEDLPGFNGAGLYDSKTQDPDETEEDGIDKSLKQVFASLWTFRAFTEREFHRIDHLAAKMGVLVHPNYSGELANGVAVSFDPIYGRDEYYYVNTQLGEDLVTNPEAHSVPEELLLRSLGNYTILATSNLVEPGQLLMSDDQLRQLRAHLEVIHDHFAGLYNPAPDDPFAMEIEFKITSENVLAIKQARPWIFSGAGAAAANTGGGGAGGAGGSGRRQQRWWRWWQLRWRRRWQLRWRRRWLRWRRGRRPTPNGARRSQESADGRWRWGGHAGLGPAEGRRRSGDHGLRGPDRPAGRLDFHRFHRHHAYRRRTRQRHGLRLSGAGGQPDRQEWSFPAGRGGANSAGGFRLGAFCQRGRHHLRSSACECGPPSDPARSLLLRSRRRADRSGIDGGCPGRSGDPRGRGADDPDGDGAAGRIHDLDPRPGRPGEWIGEGGRLWGHRRGPAF